MTHFRQERQVRKEGVSCVVSGADTAPVGATPRRAFREAIGLF
jgi:hypothetical protein